MNGSTLFRFARDKLKRTAASSAHFKDEESRVGVCCESVFSQFRMGFDLIFDTRTHAKYTHSHLEG